MEEAERYMQRYTHTHKLYIPLGLFIYCTWQHFIHSLFAFPLFSIFYCPFSCHTLSLLLPPFWCDTNITGGKFWTGDTFFHKVRMIRCHGYSYFSPPDSGVSMFVCACNQSLCLCKCVLSLWEYLHIRFEPAIIFDLVAVLYSEGPRH